MCIDHERHFNELLMLLIIPFAQKSLPALWLQSKPTQLSAFLTSSP